MSLLWYLLIGLAAGTLGLANLNMIVKGGGSGLFVNLIVGLIGVRTGRLALFALRMGSRRHAGQSGDGRHRLGHPAVDRRAHLTPPRSAKRTSARKRRSHDRLFVLSCQGFEPGHDRTKICCVTITPQLKHSLESDCKDKQKIAKTNPRMQNWQGQNRTSAGFFVSLLQLPCK